jgi:hypothetical protein
MELQLQEILYHLNTEGDINYLKNLVRNELIQEVVNNASKRHKCKKKILEDLVCDYTLWYFKFEGNVDLIEVRYLESIKKYLGRTVRNKKNA